MNQPDAPLATSPSTRTEPSRLAVNGQPCILTQHTHVFHQRHRSSRSVQASDFTTLQSQDSEEPEDTPLYATESQEEVFYEEPNLYGAMEEEDYDIVYGGEYQESE